MMMNVCAELMLLGFISLLLAVFQNRISTICIAKHLTDEWLPCNKESQAQYSKGGGGGGGGGERRRLLAEASDVAGHCEREVIKSCYSF